MLASVLGLGRSKSAARTSVYKVRARADREIAARLSSLLIEGFRATPGSLRIDVAPETDLPPGSSDDAFCWLRELSAIRSTLAEREARARTRSWLMSGPQSAHANTVDVTRERLLAIILAADVLAAEHGAETLDEDAFDRLMARVGDDLKFLATDWTNASCPLGRLSTLMAVALSLIVVDVGDALGRETLVAARQYFEAHLIGELEQQFFEDGGHVSRQPGAPVPVLAELVPLIRTYDYLGLDAPAELATWRLRLQAYLRTLRFCDRGLAPFHGADAVRTQRLATILKLDPGIGPEPELVASAFSRVNAPGLEVILDAGAAPSPDLSKSAHASFGAFVVGSGGCPLIVNCGTPRRGSASDVSVARETRSHTTLSLPGLSSAEFAPDAAPLGRDLSTATLKGPDNAVSKRTETLDTVSFVLTHDGFRRAHGLRHIRRISVSRDGLRIEGSDQLTSSGATVRLAEDLPFAVHFHVADDVTVTLTDEANCARLETPGGMTWRFAVDGGRLYVEPSPRFARGYGNNQAGQQLALRSATAGETTVRWALNRI